MFQKLFAASRKKELQKTWGLLVAKISILEEQRVIETRAEERFRLEQIIIQEREKHQQIEQELLQFEAQKHGIGSTLDNNHIAYSGDINQYWQKNSRSKNIIGFIILFIVFFVLSWVIFFIYNNSNVEHIENNEVNVMKLANKANLLLIDFALINNDNDKLVYKIREQDPNIGRLLASFPDDGLSIGVKIVKYGIYCILLYDVRFV